MNTRDKEIYWTWPTVVIPMTSQPALIAFFNDMHGNGSQREIWVDPFCMPVEQVDLFGLLFSEIARQCGINYFPRGRFALQMKLGDRSEIIFLSTNQVLICYQKKSGEYAFEVIANRLGKGSYGEVYKGNGTWRPDLFGKFYLKPAENAGHVVKLYFKGSSARTSYDEAVREYILSAMTAHLHPKKPLMVKPGIAGMVGRFIPGETLDKVIRKANLSIVKRLELSIAILEALQKQIHDHGILHRDIKPENFIIDVGSMTVKIIDLNLSRKINDRFVVLDPDGKPRIFGTPLYMSSEMFHRRAPVDELSDLCSVGHILSELWGNKALQAINTHVQLDKYVSAPVFNALFHNIVEGMAPGTKVNIEKLLLKLVSPDKTKRGTIADAIYNFNAIRSNVMLESFGRQERLKSAWLRAHYTGLAVNFEMYWILRTQQAGPVTDSHMQQLVEMLKRRLASLDLESDIRNHPKVIDELTYALNIHALRGLKKLAEIDREIDIILWEFKQILDCLDQEDAHVLQLKNANLSCNASVLCGNLDMAIKHLRGKLDACPLTVDAIVAMTEKLKWKWATEIVPIMNDIQLQIDQKSTTLKRKL